MSDSIICEACKSANSAKSYFCKSCGRFLLPADFVNTSVSADAEAKLARILENLGNVPHTDILWNETIDAYAQKIERVQSLLRLKDLGIEADDIDKKIKSFLKMCRKPDFEIAFVGTIKTGKSTLINALLGHNYASMDVTPETAALTKFRSSERDYVHVTFYNANEWNKLWASVQQGADKFKEEYDRLNADSERKLWIGHGPEHIELEHAEIENELAKWCSSKSPTHYFVKEVEVGLSSLPKDFPKQVVFVDTPGLSDPVAYRSQISKDYIHSANAVLVCIDAQKIYKEEVQTIASVFSFSSHKKDKVYIIATHWDELNDPIEDWEKQKDYLVRQLTGKAFFDTEKIAEKNIVHSAARVYNHCRDYNLLEKKDQKKLNILPIKLNLDFDPDLLSDREKLMEFTNVSHVNQIIVDELVNQYSHLLFGDITNLYTDIKNSVSRVAEERKETVEERISLSYADMKKVEKKVELIKKNKESILAYQKKLDAALKSVQKSSEERMEKIFSILK